MALREIDTRYQLGIQVMQRVLQDTQEQLASGRIPNQLRGIDAAAVRIKQELKLIGLNPADFLMTGTLGDIDMILAPEHDQYEGHRFGHLAEQLCLRGRSPEYRLAQDAEVEILGGYEDRGINLFGYDKESKGLPETRELIRQEVAAIGLETENVHSVWLGEGGMGVLPRIFRAMHNHYRRNEKRNGLLLSSSVCFTMAVNSADDNGLDVAFVETSDQPRQEMSEAALRRYFDAGGQVPDMVLLTPADNPTGHSYDPENVRKTIAYLQSVNPNATFIIDMAYMSMIDPARARAIIQVFNETGADQHAIFAVSESKRIGQPRLRMGAAVIKNPELQTRFQGDTIRNVSSFSWKTDVWYQCLSRVVTPEALQEYYQLLRFRQYALLTVLKGIDPEGKLFKNLDRIAILGFGEPKEGQIVLDNPLYLYVELQEGVDVFRDLAIPFGIFGVPGKTFGDKGNSMRFSLGVTSLEEILKRSPQAVEQFLDENAAALNINTP